MLVQNGFLWVLYSDCPIVQDKWSIQTQFICDLCGITITTRVASAIAIPLVELPERLLTSE